MKSFDTRRDSILAKANTMRKNKRRNAAIAGITALSMVLAVLFVLFVPYGPDIYGIAQYESSPYYHVIEKMAPYYYRGEIYNNHFEALIAKLESWGSHFYSPSKDLQAVFNAGAAAIPEGGPGEGAAYVEVTDNQVAGVIEADIFKRSNEYIYHLYGSDLFIYRIKTEGAEKTASYSIEDFLDAEMGYSGVSEMYLSQDCKTLTLLIMVSTKSHGDSTVILNLSAGETVRLESRIMLSGQYKTSRMIGQKLLVFGSYCVKANVDYADPVTYIPQYGWPGESQCIAGKDVLLPDQMTSGRYGVIYMLDSKTLELNASKALLSYSQEFYVSGENIYATNICWRKVSENEAGDIVSRQATEIACIRYADEDLQFMGSFVVDGIVKDQYSMDEYEGMFRVVTTTTGEQVKKSQSKENQAPDIFWTNMDSSANLYCIDLYTWNISGKVEGFAPKGEEVTSVRFRGNTAYVCTAEMIKLTDPVFFFDLTDPANIVWKDTGVIGGYSSNLVEFSEGILLGIGYDEMRNLKVEVYRQSADQVLSVASYTLECTFPEEYKCYLIEREEGYIGIPTVDLRTGKMQYLLLHFDGENLCVEKQLMIPGELAAAVRADIIHGLLYILSEDITVVKP